MENNEHLSIDGLLKASQVLLNLKNSLSTDSCGTSRDTNSMPVIKSICETSLTITSALNKIYSAK